MTTKDKNKNLEKKLKEANIKFESDKKAIKDRKDKSGGSKSEKMPDFKKLLGCG